MTGVCTLLKVLMIILCFAALTSDARGSSGRRRRRSTDFEVCRQQKETGPCRAVMPRWYYDVDKQQCIRFIYGGCGGNRNNFESQNACLEKCNNYPHGRTSGT